ncbi:MAG: hypothetical protein PUA70_00880 [Oribacterium sp.]|nr:hypothetical protein [Oribacterium sp.]
MGNKTQIALISTTINAVGPMTAHVRKAAPEYKVVNYLDGYMMDKIKTEGGIYPESISRMLDMIGKAFRDGAEGVIMTCTVFSPWADIFTQTFQKPVVPADIAMLDSASKYPGRTAIICTFEGTIDTTRNAYFTYRRKNHMPEKVDMYPIPDAFAAAQASNMDECNRLVAEKIKELDSEYDQIILAQISMSGAAELVETKHARVFTSPSEALKTLQAKLG